MKSTATGEEPHGAWGHRARHSTYERGRESNTDNSLPGPPAGAAPGRTRRDPSEAATEGIPGGDTRAGHEGARSRLAPPAPAHEARRAERAQTLRWEGRGGRWAIATRSSDPGPRRPPRRTPSGAAGRVRRSSPGPGRAPAPRLAPRAPGPQPSPPPRPQAPSPSPPEKRRPHSGAPSPRARRRLAARRGRLGNHRGGEGEEGGAEEGRGPTRGGLRRCRRRDAASGTVRAPPPPPPRLPAPTRARRLNADRTRRLDPIRPHLVRSLAGPTGSCFSDSLEAGCTLGVVVQPGSAGDHGNPLRFFAPPTKKGSSLD